MNSSQTTEDEFFKVADLQVDTVHIERAGFVLKGRGADRAEYKIEMRFDFPVDKQTKSIVGEMLAQSELRVMRRAKTPLLRASRRKTDRISS